jgi:threonine synthase
VLDVEFDDARARRALTRRALAARPRDMWRYAELLPVPAGGRRPPLHVGWTPVAETPRLADWIGIRGLRLKDEGRNPTASFKDRASAVGIARALLRRARVVACASTGNAASSLAGAAASVGLPAVIFVPEFAPEPKVAQLLVFGARVVRVKGTYDQTWELCQRACARHGWYNRNAAVNPSLVEGKKTCGLEIGEQLGAEAPDWVAVSVGDGCTFAGTWKGLREMHALGLLPRLPRMLGVQADGARPLVDAYEQGRDLQPSRAETLADSICVGHPRNWRKALRAVRESNGAMVAVPDAAILEAMREAGRRAGVFGEPAGVAALAGLRMAVERGIVGPRQRALAVVTGSGLKDVRSAIRAAGEPVTLAADDDQLDAYLRERPVTAANP